MIKKFFIAISVVFLSFNVFAADTQTDSGLPKIEEGKQYIALSKQPSPDKEVIEFFSFNCPSCYRLESEFEISKKIKSNISKDVTFKRYSLSDFGPLAPELSQAWAIANILGITDEVSTALYHGVQRDHSIKTPDDIKAVFAKLGVDSAKYENMKSNFLVTAFMAQQEEARKELIPTSIPSFYVNGKYLINTAGLNQSSNEAVIQDYSRVTNYLSQLN